MGNGKVATLPRTSGNAAPDYVVAENAQELAAKQIAEDAQRERDHREYEKYIKPFRDMEDVIRALKLPGWNCLDATQAAYDDFGDQIDKLSSEIIDLLDKYVGGMHDPETDDLTAVSHIVMAAVDYAVGLGLTRGGQHRARYYVRGRGGCPDGA